MRQFNDYFNYDLIIVHYGLNAVSHGNVKFTWFENAQSKLIKKIQSAFPNTPILLMSTSDIGYNQDGTWVTEPGVPYMVSTQRSIAKKNKIAFWDLYSSMGGENTMVNWAQQSPRLAALDYIHLNGLGAKKVADIFDMRPAAIIDRLKLKTPIYSETAAYGHMGRTPGKKTINGKTYETFTWEKLDYVAKVKKAFGLK